LRKTMYCETEDLIIRDSVLEDVDRFYQWETWPEVTEFFSISKYQTREDVYDKFFKDKNDETAAQFTILLKREGDDPLMIGRVVLGDLIPGWKGEIWRIYIADKSLRNRGYGYQALKAVMDYMFGELEMERVYLDFYTGNPAEFLYLKAGFTEEGVLRRNCRKDGVLHDVHLMSILREEYERMRKARA